MSDKPEPGAGDVSIRIGDQDFVLRPTLEAALSLSRQDGGIVTTINAVANLSLDAVARVVRLGLGKQAERWPDRELERLLWQQGLTDRGRVVRPCIDFLMNLVNGGRPIDAEAHHDPQDPPPS